MKTQPLVETPRLRCERLRDDHLEAVSRLLRDPRVGQWVWDAADHPPTERDLRDGLADKIDHWERYGFGLWLVRDRVTCPLSPPRPLITSSAPVPLTRSREARKEHVGSRHGRPRPR